MKTQPIALALCLAAFFAAAVSAAPASAPLLPDDQRSFFLEGAGWLISDDARAAVLARDEAGRADYIEHFAESVGVSRDDFAAALERRQALARAEFLTPLDVRYRLLFLNGPPTERLTVDCGQVFVPTEIWSWRGPQVDEKDDEEAVVVYQPHAGAPWRLWLPFEGKKVLYLEDMGYLLEQWYEGNGKLFQAKRFDLQWCKKAYRVDGVTGVRGIIDLRPGRPTATHFRHFIDPPENVGAWVRKVLATPPVAAVGDLAVEDFLIQFPKRLNQRMVTRWTVTLPENAEIAATAATSDTGSPGPQENRLVIQGVVEQNGKIFENFRVRFLSPVPDHPQRRALVTERPLRPGERFIVRLEVKDEVSGARAYLSRGFDVPLVPEAVVEPAVPEEAMMALEASLETKRLPGADSLLLIPPSDDVILAVWRAQALVSGDRIVKVTFLVDGKSQLTDTAVPFESELRLAQFPVEQVIRAEGYDAAGELVAADEVIINQPRGAFRVRITEPKRGRKVSGEIEATAEVVVPPERRIVQVFFEVDGKIVETLEKPPWQATVQVPSGTEFSYLAVRAQLDDGLTTEDTRILRAPAGIQDEVEVELVELYVAVTDRSNRPVSNLAQSAFHIVEQGKNHAIEKFEMVENLPLTVGVALDTSGSMAESIAEAQKAAKNFLSSVLQPQDRSFAVAFSTEPSLLMAPTDDAEAVAQAIERTKAYGNTALYDAIVTSLYYFRGVPGQRALVVLSDGADTNSHYAYREALEFARRSGVAIYTIALKVSRLDAGSRGKLTELAEETGGRSFFVNDAQELSTVYAEIEQELRSRYFLAFSPDLPADAPTGYRPIDVKVDGGYRVRTARGYYR